MNLDKLSDEKLTKYVQENSGNGFELIIDRYQDILIRYVLRLSGRGDLAEDIVQESFLSIYENIQSYDSRRKFSSWIYRIAHNKAINTIKRESKVLNMGEREDFPAPDIKGKIENEIDFSKHKDVLEKALTLIPVKYRDIIVLRFYEDKSYEEIAEIAKMPKSTVGVRINRGLKILKEKVERNYG